MYKYIIIYICRSRRGDIRGDIRVVCDIAASLLRDLNYVFV